jgi:hypothetical protein
MDWTERDFRMDVPAPRRLLERAATAGAVTVVAFFVMLLAIQHESSGCGDACYDGGLRTYEPGHAWTAYEGAWQWQAQWALGVGAFVLGLAALATSGRHRLRGRSMALTLGSVALVAAWLAWRLLEPAPPA